MRATHLAILSGVNDDLLTRGSNDSNKPEAYSARLIYQGFCARRITAPETHTSRDTCLQSPPILNSFSMLVCYE